MINRITKKMEEQEAQMLAKLNNTYAMEKQVTTKLNDLKQMSPIAAGVRHDPKRINSQLDHKFTFSRKMFV